VVEIGTPVNLFGITVTQGELIHADRHGALVIPHLKAAIDTVVANEAIVLGPAREAGFNIDKLEGAWAKFEAART
jgi:regulator of RNase E activity RraA